MTSRASHSGIGIRHVESASGLLQRRISAPNSAVSRYGALQRTHSQKSLESVGSDSSLSRVDSFQDLPHYALPGIGSRVSIRGSTSAASDLDQLFRHGLSDDVPWVQHEGGWTCVTHAAICLCLCSLHLPPRHNSGSRSSCRQRVPSYPRCSLA